MRFLTLFFCSNNGEDLLVSYCTDYVYLFKVKDESSIIADTSRRKNNKTFSESSSSSSELPPVKRLRLRGDWSDTGPQSRPEAEEVASPENNLMQRMSELFSYWMDDAMSTALRHDSTTTSSEDESEVQPSGNHNQIESRSRSDSSSSASNRDGGNAGSLDLDSGVEGHRGVSIQQNVRSANSNSDSRLDDEPNERTLSLERGPSYSSGLFPREDGNSSDARIYSNKAQSSASNENDATESDLDGDPIDIGAVGGARTVDGAGRALDGASGGTGHVDGAGDNTGEAGLRPDRDNGGIVAVSAADNTTGDASGGIDVPDYAGASNTGSEGDDEFRKKLRDAYSSGSRYTMKRQCAASKIQNFIRLHNERQKEMDRLNALKPMYMYLPQSKMLYRGHRNARTMVGINLYVFKLV